jgi:hypothetical protein
MRKINYDANGIPNRVATGVGEQTITFPHDHFYGHPDDYEFRSSVMRNYWLIIKALCERQGLTNIVMGVELIDTYTGNKRRQRGHSVSDNFVVVAGDDTGIKLVWQRYMPHNAIGAINRLFCGAVEHKMTAFKEATEDDQDRMFEPVELRHIMRRLAAGKMPYESQSE